jgi:DNA-binding Lrp family transcriptional regulator
MSGPVTLSDASVEAVARRVVDLLRDDGAAGALVDAAEIARRFGLSRETVYDRADELGAVRIGSGPRARLRFDPQAVAARLRAPAEAEVRRTRPSRRTRSTSPLLPVRGEVGR